MSQNQECSESGAPIYHHEIRQRELTPPQDQRKDHEQIRKHIHRTVGKVDTLFREMISDLVHVDIQFVAPDSHRPYWKLITAGMSERPMQTPEGLEEFKHAELAICLPADWPVSDEAFKVEANYWPVRWLKILARLPHTCDTWLFVGHTIPNDDPPHPFAENTKYCGFLILKPLLLDEEFQTLQLKDGKAIHFLTLIPLYKEELDFKLNHGLDPLLERLAKVNISELMDLNRKNVCLE